jgi:hypothetical protein
MEEHFIEQGEVDAADVDGCMEVFGEAGSHFIDQPGLDWGELDKDPTRHK